MCSSSSVLLPKSNVHLEQSWGSPITKCVEVPPGWMFFIWRVRCDLFENVLVHTLQVCVVGQEIFPGRESLIHFTWDVRREMPKNLWWAAHLRMESRCLSRCTQEAASGGLRRDVVGHVKRWVPSRGVWPSHGHGGGVWVPMWSPGDHPLFERRRNKVEDSSRVRPRCNLI